MRTSSSGPGGTEEEEEEDEFLGAGSILRGAPADGGTERGAACAVISDSGMSPENLTHV